MVSPRRLAGAFGALGLLVLTAQSAPQTGYERKAPVVAAACATCPWGAVADVLKTMMKPRGYDLQICYNCSQTNNMRLVASGAMPPPRRHDQMMLPEPPKAPVDFGVTQLQLLSQAYNGTHAFASEAPKRNLRAIGMVEHPMFVLVAVRRDSMITDLGQIAARKLPVRILAENNPFTDMILKHYGLDRAAVESWGGSFISSNEALGAGSSRGAAGRGPVVDLIIHNQTYLANTPEAQLWYDYSQQQELRYLPLDSRLLDQMQRDLKLERIAAPAGLLRGMNVPIDTVARSGQVVYGRDDMPDDFAYLLAKTMDEESARFIWTVMPLSYNQRTVAKTLDIPLHPGAARYYRERGYLR